MTELIACLSTGKGTWSHLSKLIADQSFERIFLITNQFGSEKFTPRNNTELIVLDLTQPLPTLVKEIKKNLQQKITGTEVALNLTSGTGKEHMAVLSAVLKLGVAIRLVDLVDNKVEEV
jgi:hypothetical protein